MTEQKTSAIDILKNHVVTQEYIDSLDARPTASARLETGSQGHLWVIDHCPLCGCRHVHGGGRRDDDPRRYLGSRVAHCVDGEFLLYSLIERIEK